MTACYRRALPQDLHGGAQRRDARYLIWFYGPGRNTLNTGVVDRMQTPQLDLMANTSAPSLCSGLYWKHQLHFASCCFMAARNDFLSLCTIIRFRRAVNRRSLISV